MTKMTMCTDIHVLSTDKISEVPTKILKEISVFKCENAKKKSKSSIARSARSHTLDFLDVGVLSVACESFIVRGNFIACTGVKNLNRQLLYR